ncbi:MAG: TRAP transporter small permease [Spirochaetaceae bacterium]|nr:TRAP transporter small permease [Spirochaetaceae bacterium]
MSSKDASMAAIRRLSAAIDKVVSIICALLFGAMTVDVLLGVFFRYILNSPLNFTEELARYLMVWGASLAISLGISAGEHVGLTVILDSLKSIKAKKALSVTINLFVFAFIVFMLVYSTLAALEARTLMSQALGISMFLPKLAVPLAMLLAAIQTVLTTLIIVKSPDGKIIQSSGYIDI